MRKTKEALLAEITELEKALADKQAEYNAALQAGQPAGILAIEINRLQNRLNTSKVFNGLSSALIDRADIISQDMAEREQKIKELKGSRQ